MHLGVLLSLAFAAVAACAVDDLPSPAVPAVRAPVGPLRTVDAPADFGAFDARIERRLAETPTVRGAVAVVVHERLGVVHQRAYGAHTLARSFALGTSSALLSAGVVLRLVDAGLLRLDDRIGDLLPAWGAHKETVTVAQLLSGSAGLPSLDQVRSADFGQLDWTLAPAHLCQRNAGQSLRACGRAIYEDDAPETNLPADTQFAFGGSQLQLAGALAEQISGRSWDALLEETYRAPCDARSLGYGNFHGSESVDAPYAYPQGFDGQPPQSARTANPSIDSGAYVTGPDLAKLLLMFLRGGRCGDHQVLQEGTVARMREDRIGAVYGGVTGSPTASGYGLGWFVNAQRGTVSAPGSHGTYPLIDLRRGYAVLILLEEEYIMGAQFLLDVKPTLDAMFAAR